MNWDQMHGWHSQMGGWWMVFGMGLFWLLAIVGIVFLVRYFAQQSREGGAQLRNETPLDSLKKRYARGEISKEEFDKIRKDLAA